MSSGCGCKEVYAFPHTTYPYSSCICSFWQQHPYSFVHFCKCFSFLFLGRRLICRHNNGNNGTRGAPGIIRE